MFLLLKITRPLWQAPALFFAHRCGFELSTARAVGSNRMLKKWNAPGWPYIRSVPSSICETYHVYRNNFCGRIIGLFDHPQTHLHASLSHRKRCWIGTARCCFHNRHPTIQLDYASRNPKYVLIFCWHYCGFLVLREMWIGVSCRGYSSHSSCLYFCQNLIRFRTRPFSELSFFVHIIKGIVCN